MKDWKFYRLILALVTALIFFAASFSWWRWATAVPKVECPVQDIKCEQIFVIQKGESLTSVSKRLQGKGLIRSSLAFKILVLASGLAKDIQAGDFRLEPSLTPQEIAYILAHGTLDIWLTFPEGWRREEFARRLASNLKNFDYQEFVELTSNLEGHLFPDTYLIPKEASPSAVIEIFSRNFERKFSLELERQATKKGLTKKQVLIFASIVEREAKSGEDRPVVAGILLKRWKKDWLLQADATVQYAIATQQFNNLTTKQWSNLDWWPKRLTKADLKIDSPYNTYKYEGLPPTPICNPGLAAIKAVIDPEESDYWFYLSDPSGTVHYAKTAEEHSENIERYLR